MTEEQTVTWIKKIILSCLKVSQLSACNRLINNYYNLFNDVYLYKDLQLTLEDKHRTLNGI